MGRKGGGWVGRMEDGWEGWRFGRWDGGWVERWTSCGKDGGLVGKMEVG